jgi:protein involved in polysaccharide export with SLBB domain
MNPYLRDGDVLNVPVATEFIHAQGAVARSGRFELGMQDSLLTLFKLAGDPTPAADDSRALLVHWKDAFSADSVWFALHDVYERRVNPPLQEGDRIYIYFVPQYHRQQEATILGEVARPGVYPITQGQHRLSDLVAAAGGFLGNADLTSVHVLHTSVNPRETDAEFDRLIKLSRSEMTDTEYEILRSKLAARREDFRVNWFRLRQQPELDILLVGGDEVRIDPLVTSVRVEGEVRRPGIVEFDPKRTVAQYIDLSGGYSQRASTGKVRVTRSVTGQSLRARDVQAVAPGDLIWVPERPDVTFWQHMLVAIAVTAQVATIVAVVKQ